MRVIVLVFVLAIHYGCNQKPDDHSTSASAATLSEKKVNLKLLVEGLHAPVGMAHAGDQRIFIIEQPGIVKIIEQGKLLEKPFLNISSKVDKGVGYSEKGLLGLAFHPSYKSNGRFFIYYSAPFKKDGYDHKSILAEYKVDPQNSNQALNEERVILEIPQPEPNHNGGCIVFGPDDYLYIGLGDGGGGGDRHGKMGNGQNLGTLLGKILRIDVNATKEPYKVPGDNPFVKTPGAKPEIFAYGLRNPWRFSFDKQTKEIYCGDVGQDKFEEIDIISKGGNFGWRAMEGNHPFDSSVSGKNFIGPIYEYSRAVGNSVIGGYVYRGNNLSDWQGKYFFGDWSGKLFYLDHGKGVEVPMPSNGKFFVNSLGENRDGNLFVLGQLTAGVESVKGVLYQLEMK